MARRRNKSATNRYAWYEFFAGGGMARIGLGAGWDCLFANEWCHKKAAAYRAHFGPSPELRVEDVAQLSVNDLPGRPDLVWASFPCQDLSLAGTGAGLNGSRSGTFWPFWRMMEGLAAQGRKPPVVALENVVGAITSHGGRDFAAILAQLAAGGYRFGPLVIDAVHFLPQSRPRLFIVAVNAGLDIPPALTRPTADPAWHPKTLAGAYSALMPQLQRNWVWWNLPLPCSPSRTLSSIIEPEPTHVAWHSDAETRRLLSLMSDVNLRKVREAQASGGTAVGTVYRRTRPVKIDGRTVGKTQRAEVRFDEVSGCLRTPAGGSSRQTVLIVEGKRMRSRLLSPREAARLMGVPDAYPLPGSYNEAYHLFGDGLAVPVVAWLERHLLRSLAQQTKPARTARSAISPDMPEQPVEA